MALAHETCNFDLTAKKARRMTREQLDWTITDCRDAALSAEELVRAGCSSNPGKYWDELSVYIAERVRRGSRK